MLGNNSVLHNCLLEAPSQIKSRSDAVQGCAAEKPTTRRGCCCRLQKHNQFSKPSFMRLHQAVLTPWRQNRPAACNCVITSGYTGLIQVQSDHFLPSHTPPRPPRFTQALSQWCFGPFAAASPSAEPAHTYPLVQVQSLCRCIFKEDDR